MATGSLVRRLSCALALGSAAAGAAFADPIGPDCGTCQGSIYTLEASPAPVATTANTETFRITLSIDTLGYTGAGTGIDTVAIKIASSLVSGELVDAPLGVASWLSYVNRGLNASGCAGGGGGFACAAVPRRLALPFSVPGLGGTLTWRWELEVETGSLFTGPLEASVKARYVDDARQKVGALVSEEITMQAAGGGVLPVPEPGSAAMLGFGLAGLRGFAYLDRRGIGISGCVLGGRGRPSREGRGQSAELRATAASPTPPDVQRSSSRRSVSSGAWSSSSASGEIGSRGA